MAVVYSVATNFDYLTTLIVIIATYSIARKVCKVLYEELPWNLNSYTSRSSQGFSSRIRRAYTRSHWFLSLIVKFLLVYSVLQYFLLAHAVMHKCRWSMLAEALADHYEKMDYEMRPKLPPMDQIPAFLKIASFLVLSNGVALFLLYQFRKAFNEMWGDDIGPETNNEHEIIRQETERLGIAAWILEPFCIIWLFLAYGVIYICTYPESMFLEFLTESRK